MKGRGTGGTDPPVVELPRARTGQMRSFGPFASIRARLVGSRIGAIRNGKTELEKNGKSLCGNEIVGWETWTRTRIARFRVWSPTNWTISQPMGGKKETAAGSRSSRRPRFFSSNLIGIRWGVNRERRSLASNPPLQKLQLAPFGPYAW